MLTALGNDKLMRNEMIRRMREEIGDPNGSSRYGRFFFKFKDPITKRERKFNSNAVDNKITNLDTLENLDDQSLLNAYDMFRRRWATWM